MLKNIYPDTRACVTMPNNLVGQFAAEYMSNFPRSQVIVLDNELPKAKREEILQNAANNDFDAVIIPATTFSALEAPVHTERKILETMRKELEANIDDNKKNNISTYRLETKKENLEAKLKSLKSNNNGSISFDDLNFTTVVADEVQIFKSLYYTSTYSNVRGMGSATGSKRAYDAYVKTQAILNAGGKVVFGTGTTLTNTVLELTTWFRMLAPHLAHTGLTGLQADPFISMFSQPVTDFSIDATGRNFKQYTSLKKFTNLPELANLYSTFAYTLTKEELDQRLPPLADGRPRIPPLKNGKVETVVLDISPEQDAIFEVLVGEAAHLSKERNMLAIMHDASSTSLDQRLFDSSLPESENNVINTAVKKIVEIQKEYEEKGIVANQLVFCDKGIPNRHKAGEIKAINQLIKKAKTGDITASAIVGNKSKSELIEELSASFSVYDELERKLTEAGLKVAVIHDHAKTRASRDKLQRDFNAGQYSVLLGSSIRIGAGWNLNKRLVASHDLDLPLTPGMLEQRWGRLVRQGNELYEKGLINEVRLFSYSTKKTLDSWSADLLDRKSQQFNSFAKTMTEREIEPVEEIIRFDELTAIVADNSLMLERVKLAHEVQITKTKKRAFEYKKHGYERKLDDIKKEMPKILKTMSGIKGDIKTLEERPDQFFTDAQGAPIDVKALNRLLAILKSQNAEMVTIAKSEDFEIKVNYNVFGLNAYLVGKEIYSIYFQGGANKLIEKAYALMNVNFFKKADQRYFSKLCLNYKETPTAKAEVAKTFDDNGLLEKIARIREIDGILSGEFSKEELEEAA